MRHGLRNYFMNVISGLGGEGVLGGLDKILPYHGFSRFRPSCMIDGLASLFHNHPRDFVLRCGVVLDPLLLRGAVPLGAGADAWGEARVSRYPAAVVHRDCHLPGFYPGQRFARSPSSALKAHGLASGGWLRALALAVTFPRISNPPLECRDPSLGVARFRE
jgi:hypothetical protein